jgi:hypothetical protein
MLDPLEWNSLETLPKFELTKDLCVMLLVCSFFIWRFLLKKILIISVLLILCCLCGQCIPGHVGRDRDSTTGRFRDIYAGPPRMEFPRNMQKHCQSLYAIHNYTQSGCHQSRLLYLFSDITRTTYGDFNLDNRCHINQFVTGKIFHKDLHLHHTMLCQL